MTKRNCIHLTAAILCFAVCIVHSFSLFSQNKELTVAELVAKHISSVGKAETLAKVKSRGISGKAQVQFIQGAKGQINNGQFLCVSEGQKLGMMLKYGDVTYPGEHFAYNGSDVTVGYISPGQRSPLADFVFRYNGLMKEGFMGGALSVGWPLLKSPNQQPEFKISQEKVDDVDMYVLEYSSKKAMGDAKVKLYFEPKTFHHVKTEYRVRLANDMSAMGGVNAGGNPDPMNRDAILATGRPGTTRPRATIMGNQADSIYVLTEKYTNFANIGGLVLPQDYAIEYSVEGSGATFMAKWTVLAEHWMPNGSNIDQNFFVAQK